MESLPTQPIRLAPPGGLDSIQGIGDALQTLWGSIIIPPFQSQHHFSGGTVIKNSQLHGSSMQ